MATTAGLVFPFRVNAPSFAPRASTATRMDVARMEAAAQLTIPELEARLEALPGPENRDKRRRVRERLKKLRGRADDPFAEAKAALPNAKLPTAEPLASASPPAAAPPPRQARPRQQRSRSPQRGFEPNIAW
eukprot:6924801-Prymnesium_polylepis.2